MTLSLYTFHCVEEPAPPEDDIVAARWQVEAELKAKEDTSWDAETEREGHRKVSFKLTICDNVDIGPRKGFEGGQRSSVDSVHL